MHSQPPTILEILRGLRSLGRESTLLPNETRTRIVSRVQMLTDQVKFLQATLRQRVEEHACAETHIERLEAKLGECRVIEAGLREQVATLNKRVELHRVEARMAVEGLQVSNRLVARRMGMVAPTHTPVPVRHIDDMDASDFRAVH